MSRLSGNCDVAVLTLILAANPSQRLEHAIRLAGLITI
jgi:hypothetical protein